tara:strand:- start:44546 stop:44839 length:294 start_codon:yes stop_codon:yes gene_type:complete
MNYTNLTLKGSLAAVLTDIKSIQNNGEPVYPNYPADYETIGNTVHDRFIVTEPRQEVITPATFNQAGEEVSAAVLGDYVSILVLPAGYDTGHFQTAL